MTQMQAELVLDARNGTGESPVWHAAQQALFWVDIPARKLFRWKLADARLTEWTAPEMLACIAPMGGGVEWIAGAESGMFRLKPQAYGKLDFQRLATVKHAVPGMRFNDGRCDRQGRFLAGTMLMDMAAGARVGCIYALHKDAAPKLLLDGFITPNGMAFSPDGRTMYLSDSHPSVQTIWAFDYDTDTGIPSNRRVFVDMNPLPGRPDGAAVDEDGCYWICGNDAGMVHRFTPAGKLDRSIAVPAAKPAMCSFGGARMDQLFITSITPAQPIAGYEPALAGAVFVAHPGVRGIAETPFPQ